MDQKRRVKIPIPTYQCRRSDDDFGCFLECELLQCRMLISSLSIRTVRKGSMRFGINIIVSMLIYRIMMSAPRISPGRLDTIHPTQDSTCIKNPAQNEDQNRQAASIEPYASLTSSNLVQ